MKQFLLPENTKAYKANLHAHTTVSDGNWTPEEMKQGFLEHGYQILAFSDHEIMVDHSDLNEPERFLAITSYEMSITEELPPEYSWLYAKTYHINLLAKDPHKQEHIFFNPKYMWCSSPEEIAACKYIGPLYERVYDVKEINRIIRVAKENGFLVSYNHPVWSLQDATDYTELEGVWGVEIVNGGCLVEGFDDNQPHVFEELIRQGKQVFPLATDDCHGPETAYIGFNVVHTSELTYEKVINALEKGDFYASTGPLIHQLYLENGVLHVECSPAIQVSVATEARRVLVKNIADDSKLLESVEFDLKDWAQDKDPRGNERKYFRVTVRSIDGKYAYSRAYFLPEVADQFK